MLGPIRCKTRDFIRIPKRIKLKYMYGYRLQFVYEMDRSRFIIGESSSVREAECRDKYVKSA